jgi:hypothetical protein
MRRYYLQTRREGIFYAELLAACCTCGFFALDAAKKSPIIGLLTQFVG